MAKKTLTFGVHAALALLERDPTRVLEVWLQEGRPAPAVRGALESSAAAGIAVREASRAILDRLSGSKAHQGVVVIVAMFW
uniref:RNA methyltransferase substrate-binding domain-containing protein n=1 Tax=Thioalkalivibrio sp. HK1 TaxID=1469245 RepID=UPI000570ECF1